MISFIAPCRPFDGVFDAIQRTAIVSWREAVEDARIILLGRELPTDTGADEICEPATNERGTTTLRGIWEIVARQQTEWLCVVESDIVLSASLREVLRNIENIERPFVVGQRWDIDPGASPDTAVLHPPSAISYCLFRSGTVNAGGIPPFAIGRTVHDNYLVWASIHEWNMTVIDATDALLAIHLNHPYVEYGDKASMYRSRERADNLCMAREAGMLRPYGVNDASWVLKNGKVAARG